MLPVGDGWSEARNSISSQHPDYRVVPVFKRRGSRRDVKLSEGEKKNLLRQFHGARVYACERGGEWKNTCARTRRNLEKVLKCFTSGRLDARDLLGGRDQGD